MQIDRATGGEVRADGVVNPDRRLLLELNGDSVINDGVRRRRRYTNRSVSRSDSISERADMRPSDVELVGVRSVITAEVNCGWRDTTPECKVLTNLGSVTPSITIILVAPRLGYIK